MANLNILPDTVPLSASIQSFLSSNPPRLIADSKADDCPELKPPNLFYERHLDARLMPRQVRVIPLESFIPNVFDLHIASIANQGISLPKARHDGMFKDHGTYESLKQPNNAKAVGRVYEQFTSSYTSSLACTLLFYPRIRQWSGSPIKWMDITGGADDSEAALNCYGLSIAPSAALSKDAMDVVDDETRAQLDDLSKYHRRAAWWETFFFDPQGKSLLEDLDRIASTGIWNRWHQIHGYTPPPLGTFPIPPDALNIPWSTSAAAPFSTNENTMHQPDLDKSSDGRLSEPARSYATRASSRISLRSKAKEDQALSQKRKTPHRRQPNHDTTLWPEVRLVTQKPQLMDTFLLRAWVRSVNDDTTFIIFQCGNFERIGFRHRESQTLFISNLIDVPTCPSYGRLQVGLYLAILQDAIDRLTQRQKADELRPKTKKRRRDTSDIGTSTRYKTRSMISKGLEEAANFEVVKRHASSRPLILMALRFDNYNSTAPGPFLRLGAKRKASYGPREYMSIVLTSKLGNGAIGIAYNGRLELLVDNRAREASVVVKLALEEGHVESLRHEYSIYEHLSDRGVVEGIPSVLGLFEDLESGVLALVMSHVGQNLWDLRPDKSQDFVRVPPEIEDQYVQILKNIHEAGVLHSDIGPSNLMMKGDDDAAIIDFDQARLFPDATETEQEQRLLVAMLHKRPPRPRHRDNAPRIDYQAMLAELAAESSGDSDDESSTDGPEEENSEKQ